MIHSFRKLKIEVRYLGSIRRLNIFSFAGNSIYIEERDCVEKKRKKERDPLLSLSPLFDFLARDVIMKKFH